MLLPVDEKSQSSYIRSHIGEENVSGANTPISQGHYSSFRSMMRIPATPVDVQQLPGNLNYNVVALLNSQVSKPRPNSPPALGPGLRVGRRRAGGLADEGEAAAELPVRSLIHI